MNYQLDQLDPDFLDLQIILLDLVAQLGLMDQLAQPILKDLVVQLNLLGLEVLPVLENQHLLMGLVAQQDLVVQVIPYPQRDPSDLQDQANQEFLQVQLVLPDQQVQYLHEIPQILDFQKLLSDQLVRQVLVTRLVQLVQKVQLTQVDQQFLKIKISNICVIWFHQEE